MNHNIICEILLRKTMALPRSLIYTRGGDGGESSLYTGERRSKDDATFMALGTRARAHTHIYIYIYKYKCELVDISPFTCHPFFFPHTLSLKRTYIQLALSIHFIICIPSIQISTHLLFNYTHSANISLILFAPPKLLSTSPSFLGDVDELSCVLGIAVYHCEGAGNGLAQLLCDIQCRLLEIGSSIATPRDAPAVDKVSSSSSYMKWCSFRCSSTFRVPFSTLL